MKKIVLQMKHVVLFFLTALLLLPAYQARAQCVITGDFELTTQAEVDNFIASHSCDGASEVIVEGDLIIGCGNACSNGDIDNLQALSPLIEVTGDFGIRGTTNLESLEGVNNLESVWSLGIDYNSSLRDVDGLEGLLEIGRSGVEIDHNDMLENLDGLNNVETTGGVWVASNPSLTDLGFNGVKSFNSILWITRNPALTDLGFHSLEEFEGDMIINGNDALTDLSLNSLKRFTGSLAVGGNLVSLSGFNSLEEVEGCIRISNTRYINWDSPCTGSGISIYENGDLTEISGFNSLKSQTDVIIRENPSLDDISGFGDLEEVDNLSISENSELEGISGFGSLETVNEEISIDENDGLESIPGFNALTEADQVNIYNNDLLTDVSGFNGMIKASRININHNASLADVSGFNALIEASRINIFNNVSLTDVSGFNGMTTFPGKVEIENNWGSLSFSEFGAESINIKLNVDLKEITGFKALEEITGTLAIERNNLADISGLSALKSLGGLAIEENEFLQNLDDLTGLTEVNGEVEIEDNEALTSMDGLANIDPSLIEDLRIINNDQLSYCHLSNICTYLSDETNPRTIEGNAGLCEEEEDVLAACGIIPVIRSIDVAALEGGNLLEVCYDTPAEEVEAQMPTAVVTLYDGTEQVVPVEWGYRDYDPTVAGKYPWLGELGTIAIPAGLPDPGPQRVSILVQVLAAPEVVMNSGVTDGDTLHITDCLPPGLTGSDGELTGCVYGNVSHRVNVYAEPLPEDPPQGLWKVQRHVYEAFNRDGYSETVEYYVYLYDIHPPVFRYFPEDSVIAATVPLPPVDSTVEILDVCRYVVWDTVVTFPVTDPDNGDTIAHIRRWMAEDEVGNRSYRDQTFGIEGRAPDGFFNAFQGRVTTEEDLESARMGRGAGTDSIAVSLYRLDSVAEAFVPADSTLSASWSGYRGNYFFHPVPSGAYRVEIGLPEGYRVEVGPDSLFSADGRSDTLWVAGDTVLDLGTVVLVDTTGIVLPLADRPTEEVPTERAEVTVQPVLYPNPTRGMISIRSAGDVPMRYTLINQLGQAVQQGSWSSGEEIDISEHPAGVYFMRLEEGISSGRSTVHRVLKVE